MHFAKASLGEGNQEGNSFRLEGSQSGGRSGNWHNHGIDMASVPTSDALSVNKFNCEFATTFADHRIGCCVLRLSVLRCGHVVALALQGLAASVAPLQHAVCPKMGHHNKHVCKKPTRKNFTA